MLAIVLAAFGALTASCNMFGVVYFLKWITKKLKSRKSPLMSPEVRHFISRNKGVLKRSEAQQKAIPARYNYENSTEVQVPKKVSNSSASSANKKKSRPTLSDCQKSNSRRNSSIKSHRRYRTREERNTVANVGHSRHHIDLIDEDEDYKIVRKPSEVMAAGNRYRMFKRNSNNGKLPHRKSLATSMRNQTIIKGARNSVSRDLHVNNVKIKQSGSPEVNETSDSDTIEIHHC